MWNGLNHNRHIFFSSNRIKNEYVLSGIILMSITAYFQFIFFSAIDFDSILHLPVVKQVDHLYLCVHIIFGNVRATRIEIKRNYVRFRLYMKTNFIDLNITIKKCRFTNLLKECNVCKSMQCQLCIGLYIVQLIYIVLRTKNIRFTMSNIPFNSQTPSKLNWMELTIEHRPEELISVTTAGLRANFYWWMY